MGYEIKSPETNAKLRHVLLGLPEKLEAYRTGNSNVYTLSQVLVLKGFMGQWSLGLYEVNHYQRQSRQRVIKDKHTLLFV